MGASEHWSNALMMITDGAESAVSADAILEYFKPLEDWLRRENAKNYNN
jgi:hypothetical protein